MDSHALLQIARDYNPASHAIQTTTAPLVARPKSIPGNLQTEQEYESPIKQYFSQENFDQLEKAASEAREGKGRILGGV
ncbi:MAG TPA: hypothetical protein VJ324_12980, partial [Candidatus Acidoferrum sp.]|nr:hypothetical protein [Candidatus Acidoferrum sp.]